MPESKAPVVVLGGRRQGRFADMLDRAAQAACSGRRVVVAVSNPQMAEAARRGMLRRSAPGEAFVIARVGTKLVGEAFDEAFVDADLVERPTPAQTAWLEATVFARISAPLSARAR